MSIKEKNLGRFILLLSHPLSPLPKEKIPKFYREFMSFCFSLGNGKISLSEKPKYFSRKKMIADLKQMSEWRDVCTAERQRLNNLPEETTVQGKYNAMMDYGYCTRSLEMLSLALNVIGDVKKDTFSIARYQGLMNKADEIKNQLKD